MSVNVFAAGENVGKFGTQYLEAKIVNIRRGKGDRRCYIFADLVDKDGMLLISATLDYIVEALKERLP